MKKGNIKLLCIMLGLLCASLMNAFIKNPSISILYNCIIWFILLVLLIMLFGFEKNKALFRVDAAQIVLIYTILYIVIIYLLGIMLGFKNSPYSLDALSILKNIFPVIILLVLKELSRYVLVCKSKSNKVLLVINILIFIAFDIIVGLDLYYFESLLGIYEFIGVLLIPSIITNLLLTYFCYNTGYKVPILYQLILNLYPFIVPILPDLNSFIVAVLGILLPLVIFLRINRLFVRADYNILSSRKKKLNLSMIVLIIISFSILALNLGIFKYSTIAIMSNSMYPGIKIGDVVILEKIDDDKIYEFKTGDIIAVEKENKIIIHRISRIYEYNDKKVIRTKGDNNDKEDADNLYEDDIVGIVKLVIPKIGYPSVWINQF